LEKEEEEREEREEEERREERWPSLREWGLLLATVAAKGGVMLQGASASTSLSSSCCWGARACVCDDVECV
jgi:hypothetical protein